MIDGKVYVAGGYLNDAKATDVLEIFDPTSGTWSADPAMPQARFAHASAALGGQLYVIGGEDTSEFFASCYRFDPIKKQWSQIASLNMARSYAGTGVVGGRLYVVGGLNPARSDMNSGEVYDLATDRWTLMPAMSLAAAGRAWSGSGASSMWPAGAGRCICPTPRSSIRSPTRGAASMI